MGDSLPTIDIADVWTSVGDLLSQSFVADVLVALTALAFAPRILRFFRGAARGR